MRLLHSVLIYVRLSIKPIFCRASSAALSHSAMESMTNIDDSTVPECLNTYRKNWEGGHRTLCGTLCFLTSDHPKKFRSNST